MHMVTKYFLSILKMSVERTLFVTENSTGKKSFKNENPNNSTDKETSRLNL